MTHAQLMLMHVYCSCTLKWFNAYKIMDYKFSVSAEVVSGTEARRRLKYLIS